MTSEQSQPEPEKSPRAEKREKQEHTGGQRANAKENTGRSGNAQVVMRRKMVSSRKKKELKPSTRSSYKKLHLGKNGKKLPPTANEKNAKLMEEYRKVIADKHIPPKKPKPRAKRQSEKVDKFLTGADKAGASKSDMTRDSLAERRQKRQSKRETPTEAFGKKKKTETGEKGRIEIAEKDSRQSLRVDANARMSSTRASRRGRCTIRR